MAQKAVDQTSKVSVDSSHNIMACDHLITLAVELVSTKLSVREGPFKI